MNWVEPFLLWLLVSIRIITLHVPAGLVLVPVHFVWSRGVTRIENLIPQTYRTIAGAIVVAAALLLGVFIPDETPYNLRSDRAVSMFGYIVFLAGLYATSRNRKAVVWRPVIVGVLAQFIVGFFVLQTELGKTIFKFLADALTTLLVFAYDGVVFLTEADITTFGWFIVNSLSVFVFFVALVQMAYYVGLIQWAVPKIAYVFGWAFGISGAEALAAATTPFLGMGEAAIVIKGFVPLLTQAEIHQVMTSGFATISGSLMIVYIGLGASGQAVISSCVMSIPISIVISKIRVPETEDPLTRGIISIPNLETDDGNEETNILHAMANGAWIGLKVAGMVMANLLVIIAVVALLDGILHWTFKYIQAPNITISKIFGYIFYPVAFLMGVPRSELYLVGQLIGMKTIQNEFVAFAALTGEPQFQALSQRSNIIATYAVCGFANIGSIGIQLGIYGSFSQARRGDFARNAVSACICGALATFMSAVLAGMIFTG
ncbi:NupC family nucleoside cotransporter [Diplocarpon rosae]|nr:NupC family nucleoside cotransporter [Diplocarpon rosae]